MTTNGPYFNEAAKLARRSRFRRASTRRRFSFSSEHYPEKLTPLLRLKCNDFIADAIADLRRPEEIGAVFAGIQQYLYAEVA